MRRKLSALLIGLGVLMILGAAALLLHNRQEADREASFSARMLPQLEEVLLAQSHREAETLPFFPDPLTELREMTVTEIDGRGFVGVLEIPAMDYRAPILSECTYANLDVGACRFYGSTFGGNLVLCAHNYNALYRRLESLRVGDEVLFTDMDGLTWTYTMEALEVLDPDMVTEMTDSGYDLSFFTCTYGGQARLTLRCLRS